MLWRDGELNNPLSGKVLRRDTAHSLTDGERRFPIVDEIPFLRIGREELAKEVLRALDCSDYRAALFLLLPDQDDWARTAPPVAADLETLFDNPEINLRGAMQSLKYAAVGDYFAFRWSDPTFLSGLALLDYYLPPPIADPKAPIFELCCGIGHYLREMILRGFAAAGADVVFSKLWLARHFVAPAAKLICCDANFALPFADKKFDISFCHDAFYFLPNKPGVAAELKRTTDGAILIGHAHNSEADNFSSGAAISADDYAALFGDSIFYDDAELTAAHLAARPPEPRSAQDLRTSAAIAIVERAGKIAAENRAGFDLPPPNRRLRINPLLHDAGENRIRQTPLFPSARYEAEYAADLHYLNLNSETISATEIERAINGDWATNEKLENLVRRRILLDLPKKW